MDSCQDATLAYRIPAGGKPAHEGKISIHIWDAEETIEDPHKVTPHSATIASIAAAKLSEIQMKT